MNDETTPPNDTSRPESTSDESAPVSDVAQRAPTNTTARTASLWLEIAKVRFIHDRSGERLEVQLKGQYVETDQESWWPVSVVADVSKEYFKALTEALDKKRRAFVRAGVESNTLVMDALRLDYLP
jgi:hypothetical protein